MLHKQNTFVWLVCLFSIFLVGCSNKTEGPYLARILEFRDCNGTREMSQSYPVDEKFPYVMWKSDIINTKTESYLKGNYTVVRETINFKMRIRLFFWEDDQWRMRLIIPSMTDDRVIFRIVAKAFGPKYFYNNHTLPKSPMAHFKVNINWLSHAWEREKAYGQWMWVIQAIVARRSVYCNVLKLNVIPIKS